jgi:hypothetical protein
MGVVSVNRPKGGRGARKVIREGVPESAKRNKMAVLAGDSKNKSRRGAAEATGGK